MNELTKTQYDILERMGTEYCYPFRHFDDLNLTRKELSQEFKILREAGLVYYQRGLMTEEGYTGGSGYGIDNSSEVSRLMDEFEERNKETHEQWQNNIKRRQND
jgi:hypothetical protein